MTSIMSTGSTVSGQGISAVDHSSRGSVSVQGNQINVKAGRTGTLLDQYRSQGVDLDLSEMPVSGKFTEEELEKMQKEKEENWLRESYQEQLEAAKESAEAAGEGFEDMGRALEIARRMMHGDHVPASDEKFLMDYNRDIYMGAKNMQALAKNDDPKDYDSILEDEEEESVVSSEGGGVTISATGLNLCNESPQISKS